MSEAGPGASVRGLPSRENLGKWAQSRSFAVPVEIRLAVGCGDGGQPLSVIDWNPRLVAKPREPNRVACTFFIRQ